MACANLCSYLYTIILLFIVFTIGKMHKHFGKICASCTKKKVLDKMCGLWYNGEFGALTMVSAPASGLPHAIKKSAMISHSTLLYSTVSIAFICRTGLSHQFSPPISNTSPSLKRITAILL